MSPASRPRIVILGTMSTMAVAGVIWQYIHYLKGFELLGYESWYVEDHGKWPRLATEPGDEDGSRATCELISGVMGRFDLGDRWAFRARHSSGELFGISEARLARLFRDASLIVNLHGATVPQPEHSATGRLVYLETDPAQVQVGIAEQHAPLLEFLQPHAAYFTFGENLGNADCALPVSTTFPFIPTRQPVVLDYWRSLHASPRDVFTTIASWRQTSRPLAWKGRTYVWSKHRAFRRFAPLPTLTGQVFELALNAFQPSDRKAMECRGWRVIDGYELSRDASTYRDYVASSRAEFTVAKDQYVLLRTGWFSDRSATYLAAGRPVVTQDTGLASVLPIGKGLLTFSHVEDAVDGIEQVSRDPGRHSRAASAIAREYFAHDVVLGRLLGDLGLQTRAPSAVLAAPLLPRMGSGARVVHDH